MWDLCSRELINFGVIVLFQNTVTPGRLSTGSCIGELKQCKLCREVLGHMLGSVFNSLSYDSILCRYIKRELFHNNKIQALPACFMSWTEFTSQSCMFTDHQRKVWTMGHLREGCWYLEGPKGFVTSTEQETYDRNVKIQPDGMQQELFEPDESEEEDLPVVEEEIGKRRRKRRALARDDGSATTGIRSRKKQHVQEKPMAVATMVPVKAAMKPPTSAPAPVKVPQSPASAYLHTSSNPMVLEDNDRSSDIDLKVMPIAPRKGGPWVVHEYFGLGSILSWARKGRSTGQMPLEMNEVGQWIQSILPGRPRFRNGVMDSHRGYADLIIADLPESLPVPFVSNPSNSIPKWNEFESFHLRGLFQFASSILHDNGAMFIFLPDDGGERFARIQKFLDNFGFAKIREWWGGNRLRLVNAREESKGKTNNMFVIHLLVRASDPEVKRTSDFKFRPPSKIFARVGIDIAQDNIVYNYTTTETQLERFIESQKAMVPWRGAREKDPHFMECLIEATTDVGDVVVDVLASTGAAVRACRCIGRNIAALEEDPDIYHNLLKGLQAEGSPPVGESEPLVPTPATTAPAYDSDEEFFRRRAESQSQLE